MKRLVEARLARVLVVAAAGAVALVVAACGPKDDKPPLTPDDPTVSDLADAGPG